MAAPPEVTMHDFTGSWLLNKTLSDSFDSAFVLQGIPWIIRKVISLATLTMKIAHSVDESGVPTVIFTQAASVAIAGLSEEIETRWLDGREQLHSSSLFGTSSARTRMICFDTATGYDGKPLDAVLTKDFLREGKEGEEEFLFDLVVHQTRGWVMEQIWGFGMLNGERRLLRKMGLKKGGEAVYVTAWYDWKGRDDGD
ncbi:uncharacterized protein J4E88_005006 [Alternaria novae-zelandiae]|uniref:uncharacterized protein n=1 Tax=Alternaria novae-zelandiae TaxID=430562 RepID=UPI0020C4046A|nr:uncharacterized protein J4E88_005006 [Alternaria novae-zelandiae]KAI4682118.1 hypothetical protein J4E88_005006 [Alternaria novae-zelandiae]